MSCGINRSREGIEDGIVWCSLILPEMAARKPYGTLS